MGIFSGKKETKAYTAIQRMSGDDDIVLSSKVATLHYLLENAGKTSASVGDKSLTDYMIQYGSNALPRRCQRAYNYADADNYASLLMNPADNLANIDEEYLKLLEGMPEKERNRFLHGIYNDESDGQVYYSFRRDEHVKDTKQIPGTLFSGHDFNVNPMTGLIAQIYDGKFYIHDELWLENSDTYKLCDEMKRKGYAGTSAIPDSTGANRKTSGKTDFQIMREAGMTIMSTHNPFVTDRVNNVNRLFQTGKIVINPKCKKLINDLEKVSWKNNEIDPGKDKMLGHITDCLGYICWKLDPFSKIISKVEQQTIR